MRLKRRSELCKYTAINNEAVLELKAHLNEKKLVHYQQKRLIHVSRMEDVRYPKATLDYGHIRRIRIRSG
jgi:hypothetical protein